jgi:TatD DNase family protein
MKEQWKVALDAGLPVIVHNRDSNEEMMAAAVAAEHEGLTGVFHSFAGGLEMGADLVERGFYLGLSGMVTFPRADNVREVLPELSRERFLIETDTPYLAPVPHRGEKNRPAFVVETAKRVAEEWESSLEDLAELTTANFFRLFPRARQSK